MRSSCLAVSFAALTVFSLAAHATPITYTETVTADGSLGGTSFISQLVTITGIGDTGGIGLLGPGVYFLDLTSGSVRIGAGSAAIFTGTLIAISNQGGPTASLGESSGDMLDDTSAAFATYALNTAISATGNAIINPGMAFGTSAGDFDMLNTGSQSTFTASLGAATAPEPVAFALLATGLLGLAKIGRRRHRSSLPSV
jgi:hypothetical protein